MLEPFFWGGEGEGYREELFVGYRFRYVSQRLLRAWFFLFAVFMAAASGLPVHAR